MKPRTTIEFLDALKEHHSLKSDYALAKFMHASTANISRYRNGWTFDAKISLQVADLLGLPVGYVLACIEEEREAKRPEVKAAWRKVAEALAPTGAGSHRKQRDSVYYVKHRPVLHLRMRSSRLEALRRFSPPRPRCIPPKLLYDQRRGPSTRPRQIPLIHRHGTAFA